MYRIWLFYIEVLQTKNRTKDKRVAEILFIGFMSLLIAVSRRLYGTHLTPFTVLASVYIVLIPLNNLLFTKIGFEPVEALSLLYLSFFLGLIFLVGMVVLLLVRLKRDNRAYEYAKNYYTRVIESRWKLIFSLFVIGLTAKYITLFSAVSSYGILDTKGTSSGVLAHIGNIGMMLTPLVFAYYMNHKKQIHLLVMIFLMFASLIAFGGKYPVMILFLYTAFLYLMLNKMTTKSLLKVVTVGIILTVVMFIAIYTVKPILDYGEFDDRLYEDGLNFTFQHLIFYAEGSVVAMNEFFTSSYGSIIGGVAILFTVPINIALAVTGSGNYIDPVIAKRIEVAPDSWANVGGMISESVYHVGFFGTALYTIAVFSFIYLIYVRARYSGRMIALASSLLAISALSFFCNFMTVSGIMIPILFLVLVELLLDSNFLRYSRGVNHA